ncbi:MAG: prolyl oligopeptidase family serine peptidase [Clostridia bacterium]|nr:prolyl oligopeptidase family serine peptidase [Clostridia bacterium]
MITHQDFEPKIHTDPNGFSLPYRIRIPEGEGLFPLLICMHGAGERGTDNQAQIGYFLPIFNHENSPALQAIAVMPQCPDTMRWVEYGWDKGSYQSEAAPLSPAFQALEELLEQLLATLPIDRNRIYITGLSMGGFATWRMLAEHADLFTAGMPICGGGPLDQADRLATLPIRAFHCADDPIVPPKASRDMVAEIQNQPTHQTHYIEYPNGGHGAWGPTYDNPENTKWLFDQSK